MNGELRTQPDLKGFLNKHIDSIQEVASAVITPERMVKLVLAACSREPKLAECSPLSLLRSMMQAAELGLEVCSGKNEGYLIPRYNGKTKKLEATFLPGYQGLIKLVCESGQVRNVEARIVYGKDTFEVEQGTNPHITHRPSWDKDRGKIVAVYAVAFFPDGTCQFEVMPWHEIEAIRDRSKDGKDGFSPWKSDEGEMGRKTAVRRLSKYLRKSPALARALEIQAKAEAGEYDMDPEPIRPGDSQPAGQTTARVVNEDGDLEVIWTDEERAEARAMCEEMTERLLESGMDEKAAEDLMAERWNGIGLPDLSYHTWTNRFLTFRERHVKAA